MTDADLRDLIHQMKVGNHIALRPDTITILATEVLRWRTSARQLAKET